MEEVDWGEKGGEGKDGEDEFGGGGFGEVEVGGEGEKEAKGERGVGGVCGEVGGL